MQSVPITIKAVSSNPAHAKCIAFCDKVCQLVAAGRWFSSGSPGFLHNNIDHHDIAEILLKVALNTITLRSNT